MAKADSVFLAANWSEKLTLVICDVADSPKVLKHETLDERKGEFLNNTELPATSICNRRDLQCKTTAIHKNGSEVVFAPRCFPIAIFAPPPGVGFLARKSREVKWNGAIRSSRGGVGRVTGGDFFVMAPVDTVVR